MNENQQETFDEAVQPLINALSFKVKGSDDEIKLELIKVALSTLMAMSKSKENPEKFVELMNNIQKNIQSNPTTKAMVEVVDDVFKLQNSIN